MCYVSKVLKKQIQLIDIESNSDIPNKVFGYPGINPSIYYEKLKLAKTRLEEAVQLIDSVEQDVYNDRNQVQ